MKQLIVFFALLMTTVTLAQISPEAEKLIAEKQRNKEILQIEIQKDLSQGKFIDPQVQKGIVAKETDGMYIFTELLNEGAGKNVNVDQIWNLSINGTDYILDGTDMMIYMWDGGKVRSTHQELVGRVSNEETMTLNGHATAVAGTIGASGVEPAAKGMAPNIQILAYDYPDFETEIPSVTEANISNHSYGTPTGWSYRDNAPYGDVDPGEGWYFISNYDDSPTEGNFNGNYTSSTVFWDDAAYAAPNHIMVKSAGNSQNKGPNGTTDPRFRWDGTNWVTITGTLPENNCANGYDCLLMESCAKNIVVVGAIEKITANNGRYEDASDVEITNFSSLGPRDDGGIKPDVVAPGNNIYTLRAGSDMAYNPSVGTSFSSPTVAGVIALWNRLYFIENGNYMRSDLAKALVCHTAQEAGPHEGPDYKYGWGLVNALEGATTIVGNGATYYVGNESLNEGSLFEQEFEASGDVPFKATISWLDPSAEPIPNSLNDRTSRLVNDLDLKIIDLATNTEILAWKLDPDNPSAAATKGDNLVDNVEQVVVESPTAEGMYKIVVSHKGSLVDNDGNALSASPFGLVVSGVRDTMGTEDIDSALLDVSIYPNPTASILNYTTSNEEKIISVSIFNGEGKMVVYQNKDLNGKIDVSHLETGMYRLLIHTRAGKVSKSFLVQ